MSYVYAAPAVKPVTLNVTVVWLGATVYAFIAVNDGAATLPVAATTAVADVVTVATAVAIEEAAVVVTVKVLAPRVPRVPCGVAVRVEVDDAVAEFV